MRTPRPWILPVVPTSGAELGAAGVSASMLRTQVASGALLRLRPTVYLSAARWPVDAGERHVLLSRAELVVHARSVMSHASAASVWGLPHPGFGAWAEEGVHLTRETGSRPARGGVTHHHGPLPVGQLTRDGDGYAVTTAARTGVDLAGGLALPEALVLLDAAARLSCAGFVAGIRRRDYRNPTLVAAARALLADAATTVRCARLREVVALVEPCRESPIESLSAGHFEVAGLPRPLFQEPLRTRLGIVFPDCYWPEYRLIGEADGAVKYADAAAIVREKEREQALRDEGYRIVRWSGKEILTAPAVVAQRVGRSLGRG